MPYFTRRALKRLVEHQDRQIAALQQRVDAIPDHVAVIRPGGTADRIIFNGAVRMVPSPPGVPPGKMTDCTITTYRPGGDRVTRHAVAAEAFDDGGILRRGQMFYSSLPEHLREVLAGTVDDPFNIDDADADDVIEDAIIALAEHLGMLRPRHLFPPAGGITYPAGGYDGPPPPTAQDTGADEVDLIPLGDDVTLATLTDAVREAKAAQDAADLGTATWRAAHDDGVRIPVEQVMATLSGIDDEPRLEPATRDSFPFEAHEPAKIVHVGGVPFEIAPDVP